MLRELEHYKAVGLACTQLALPIRMIVAIPNNMVITMVNPVIVEASEKKVSGKEGCLSIPGYWDMVPRHDKITVKYQDITGRECEDTLYEYAAAVVQHEIEHLDGILFIDHLSTLKQARARKKVDFWKRKSNLKNKVRRNI